MTNEIRDANDIFLQTLECKMDTLSAKNGHCIFTHSLGKFIGEESDYNSLHEITQLIKQSTFNVFNDEHSSGEFSYKNKCGEEKEIYWSTQSIDFKTGRNVDGCVENDAYLEMTVRLKSDVDLINKMIIFEIVDSLIRFTEGRGSKDDIKNVEALLWADRHEDKLVDQALSNVDYLRSSYEASDELDYAIFSIKKNAKGRGIDKLFVSIHSDIHNEYRRKEDQVNIFIPQADVIVLAGDITLARLLPEYIAELCTLNPTAKVIIIFGNHELYGADYLVERKNIRNYYVESDTVYFLDNDYVEIDGVEFIGSTLWTNFELGAKDEKDIAYNIHHAENGIADFGRIRCGKQNAYISAEDMRAEFWTAKRFIEDRLKNSTAKKKVVVTHFAPHPTLIHTDYVGDRLTPYFVNDCRDLFELKPDLWIFGHTHENHWRGDVIDGVLVESNQCGYQSEKNTGYNPNHLVEI